MRNEVLNELHDSPASGVEKILASIKQIFWWPSLKTTVEKHKANCARCAARSTAAISTESGVANSLRSRSA